MKKIRVCNSKACTTFGAASIMEAVERGTGVKAGESNLLYDVDYCGCVGWCSNAPNVEVDDELIIMDSDPQTIMSKIERGDGKLSIEEPLDIKVEDNFLGDI